MNDEKSILIILGPTGVGKTAAAIQLCIEFGGEVISCDSMQVYRRFSIGTAKPRLAECFGVPHHLIDICDPTDLFSAADFVRRTLKLIPEIESRGKRPVIVGGTGLYFRSLLEGIFEGPPRVPDIRDRLRAKAAEPGGMEDLYKRLGEVDPVYQSRIHPNDRIRIVRALEVAEVTGIPLSVHFEKNSLRLTGRDTIKLGLLLPRHFLHERIDQRVDSMLRAGFIEEVLGLLSENIPRSATPFGGLGYAQIVEYLDGKKSFDETRVEIQKETRRYAKRQMTWFRREKGVIWLRADRLEWLKALVRHSLL